MSDENEEKNEEKPSKKSIKDLLKEASDPGTKRRSERIRTRD